MKRSITTPLAPLLQRFFVERLQRQRQASPRTVAAYRDCFRLLLAFAKQKLRKEPADLAVEDLNVTMILDFLQHLEKHRKNRVTSRNARFAAIRSFMQYASFEEPAVTDTTRTVLAIPMKRTERPLVAFLSREQVEAIVAAPDTGRWFGRRDRVLLATLYNTGARVSEATGIQVQDLTLDGSPAVRLHGKGRKERSVPIWPETAKQLRQWLREQPHTATSSVFPNRAGGRLSRTTVAERLQLAVRIAAARHPELLKYAAA
jgi:integrase/recombinase XerD